MFNILVITALLATLSNVSYIPVPSLILRNENNLTYIKNSSRCTKTFPSIAKRYSLDYSRLEKLLKDQKWKQADRETLSLMLKAKNRRPDGLFTNEDLANFPCPVLSQIDILWVKYSNVRFGFSTQLEVDNKWCAEYADFHSLDYKCFSEKVGWQGINNYSDLQFDISAPRGHLPAVYILLAQRMVEKCPNLNERSSPERIISPQQQRECTGTYLMLAFGGPLSWIYPECPTRLSIVSPYTYFQAGLKKMMREDFHGAIDDFSQAIKLNPQYAEAYRYRGSVYRKLEKYQQAIADFDLAIQINPQYSEAYNSRGGAYAINKKYRRAIEDFDLAIKYNDQNAEAYFNRGRAYKLLGNNQQARRNWLKAASLLKQQNRMMDYHKVLEMIQKLPN